MQLNGKNEARVRPGMAFNVAVGLEGLEDKEATDKRGATYALFLADTVMVVEGGGAAEVYTDKGAKADGHLVPAQRRRRRRGGGEDQDGADGPARRRDHGEPHARRGARASPTR